MSLSQMCVGLAVCGLSSLARLAQDGSQVGAEFRDREGEGRKRETEIETQRENG